MNQSERRIYLIQALIEENPNNWDLPVPTKETEQKQLLRALFNMRSPKTASLEFLKVQDEYLQERVREKGVVERKNLTLIKKQIYLWQGDITTLKVDAIVNAANSGMTGCYVPCHSCIDNAIHTYSGIQLRLACAEIMRVQGSAEPTGKAKITSGYDLPCKYVIHTVGPIVHGAVTEQDCNMLQSCYQSCMELAVRSGISSIAFCCISTGEFHFPNELAAEIAIQTVERFLQENHSKLEVVFNVFKDRDYKIYAAKLGADC